MADIQISGFSPVVSVEDGDIFHINELATGGDRKITFVNLEQQIVNDAKANNTEAVGGTNDARFMTPLKTKAQLDSRLSDESTATTGTDNTKVMTPLRTVQSITEQTPNVARKEYREVLSGASTASVNTNYHITVTNTITLPSTTGLPVGTVISFTKQLSTTPIIEVNGGNGEVITLAEGSDTSVSYDINAEILFIFNGTNWEL